MDKKHILICDNEMGVRESLRLILKDGYHLTLCNNDKECLNLLEAGQKFNLLLLDIKKKSLDILKKVKEKNPMLKTIIILNYKDTDMVTEATKIGASDYIVKPFSSKEVLNSIEKNL